MATNCTFVFIASKSDNKAFYFTILKVIKAVVKKVFIATNPLGIRPFLNRDATIPSIENVVFLPQHKTRS